MRSETKAATSILSAIAAYGLGIAIVAAVGSSLNSHPSPPPVAVPPMAPGRSAGAVAAAPRESAAAEWQPYQLAGEITIIRSDGETTNAIAPPTVLDLNAPLQSLTLEQAAVAPPSSAASAKSTGPRVFTADGATSFGGAGGDSPDLVAPRYYSFDGHVVEAITRLNRGEEGNPKWAKRTTVRPLY